MLAVTIFKVHVSCSERPPFRIWLFHSYIGHQRSKLTRKVANTAGNNNLKQFRRSSEIIYSRYNTVPYLDITTYGRHSLRYLGPKLWEKLPTAERSTKTLIAFTNRIRKCDITNLRADFWNYRKSGVSREISNSFIFCPYNLCSGVFSN